MNKMPYCSALNVSLLYVCEHVGKKHTPVGAPWDGWDEADVREKDGVVFDAVQSVVHLTERQSVQLELELHLKQEKKRRTLWNKKKQKASSNHSSLSRYKPQVVYISI